MANSINPFIGLRGRLPVPSGPPPPPPPIAPIPVRPFLEGEAGGERKMVRCVWGAKVALGGAEYAPAPPSIGSSLKSNLPGWNMIY